ncbi:ABC transporter ATP-binding protein [Parabacteroides bouchesdurhonensis]|uniref:ABC transporter ATP-binding protein n=1 Tax=Parabacteroides bouchesdurhonensis TaxID=1936995 RepID=UPI001F2237EA|nr:ABC transporter ATP-binding protein [Parabacteroides bouchesdurhonensis]
MKLIPKPVACLYKILPGRYRRKLLAVGASVFASAVVDLIGIGVLLPILLLVLSEDNMSQNKYLSLFYEWGGFESNRSFICFISIFIFLISAGKLLFTTYMQYAQNKRLFELSSYLSLHLYRYYYAKGFLFIKQNNSHTLINKVNSVASNLIQGYFIPFSSLICEMVVIISILAGIILFNIYVFLLVILTFVPVSMLYYRFSRARIRQYGRRLFELAPLRGKLLQQTFVGYSDMEMSNSFSLSLDKFQSLLREQNSLSIRNTILNSSLQRVLELAVICSVIVLIIATQLFQLPSLGIIIGLFAIAIYRVLPGIVKSTGYIFTMRGNSFALDLLDDLKKEEIDNSLPDEQKEIQFNRTVCFDKVSFSYKENVPVLNNLFLEIKKGDFIGIKGESGSGKSTLFHLFLGFLRPDSGIIYVDGQPLSPDKMVSWHRKIGYVSQQLFMIEGTLADNIVMGQGTPDRKRILEVLKLASLDKFINTLSDGIDTFVGEGGCLLSGGQRQRLGIARALYKDVEILLFDEATSSLDEATEKAINQAIIHLSEQCRSLTLLVISHRQESLAICRKIVDIESLQN